MVIKYRWISMNNNSNSGYIWWHAWEQFSSKVYYVSETHFEEEEGEQLQL